tara:strand:- start:352 stop:528 length:177 start_codon:yes stop_codon:yes gene_type:complete
MEKLNLDIDDKTLDFLLYLVNIKRYDGLSLWRVLDKPNQVDSMYNDFLKMREKNKWEQ